MAAVLCACAVCMSGCAPGQVKPETGNTVVETARKDQGAQEISRQQEERTDTVTLYQEDFAGSYAYEMLSAGEQIWYRDINRILADMEEEGELSEEGLEAGLDESHVDRIFQCVLSDHPEYFYVDGYTYTKYTRLRRLVKLEFSGCYSMDEAERDRRRAQITEAAGRLLAGIAPEASEYEKVKYVYETVISNTEYDLQAQDHQNIYSVFVGGRSVCQGYAKAVQYLLQELSVPCSVVMGKVDTGEGHAWNLVQIDGEYYYVDATWGDASYQNSADIPIEADGRPRINYDYLCVTTKQLLKTHTIENVVPVPECDSLAANYYVREGVYFTSFDEQKIKEVFQRAFEAGRSDVTLKCSDERVYEEMLGFLITDRNIFSYLAEEESYIAYAQNEKQLSLTFWMTNE